MASLASFSTPETDPLGTPWEERDDIDGFFPPLLTPSSPLPQGSVAAKSVSLVAEDGLFGVAPKATVKPHNEAHTVGAVTARMAQLLKGDADEMPDIRTIAESTLWVMMLAAGLEPASKKRKANSTMAIPTLLNEEEPGTTGQTAPPRVEKKVKRAVHTLAEIWAREGLGAVDWTEIAKRIMVPLNLVEFWQVSPEGAKQFRHLSSRKVNRRKTKGKQPEGTLGARSAVIEEVGSEFRHTYRLARGVAHLRTYRVDVTIAFGFEFHDRYAFPQGAVQADQGSEANVISGALVAKLGIPVQDLATIGFKGLAMACADGRRTPLHHFVSIHVVCEGLTREQWAVVRPEGQGVIDDTTLILGLPWLYDVGAVIDIRNGTLEIGDRSQGEERQTVKGPAKVREREQRLVLGPDTADELKRHLELDEDSSTDDHGSISSDGADSDSDSDISGN